MDHLSISIAPSPLCAKQCCFFPRHELCSWSLQVLISRAMVKTAAARSARELLKGTLPKRMPTTKKQKEAVGAAVKEMSFGNQIKICSLYVVCPVGRERPQSNYMCVPCRPGTPSIKQTFARLRTRSHDSTGAKRCVLRSKSQ